MEPHYNESFGTERFIRYNGVGESGVPWTHFSLFIASEENKSDFETALWQYDCMFTETPFE